ncbi:MAG: hypothetical protein QM784_00205 [Polyangiaceae bacterium]
MTIFASGQSFAEMQNMRHFGAAPAVDELIVVADDTEVAMTDGEVPGDPVLKCVGVLVLVDENVIESLCFGSANVGVLLQELFGQQKQVVEINRRPLREAVPDISCTPLRRAVPCQERQVD